MKQKYPRALAIEAARELCDALKPVTSRLIVAGSLRRRALEVGDVEILYIPAEGCDAVVADFLAREILVKRPNVKGHYTWGKLNKLAIHARTGVPVDLFATCEANWWVSVVFRTGSLEMNLLLTRSALRHGRSLMAYGPGVQATRYPYTIVPATSERHVFDLCGVPYRDPRMR
jgi:DNA polymerase/3'-5' exonuclease PolX